jgi:hypothetical protein
MNEALVRLFRKDKVQRIMATATTATEPVYRDWEALYEQRFDLLGDAIRRVDPMLPATMEVQDRLSNIDYRATFHKEARALGLAVFNDSSQQMKQLKDRLQLSNEKTKVNCDVIMTNMESVANSPASQDKKAWEAQINNYMDYLKGEYNKEIVELRVWAKERIKGMPQKLRPVAARSFSGGANAVFQFFTNALGWLGGALDSLKAAITTTVTRVKNAWGKIKQWANSVKNWFVGAWNTIQVWFPGVAPDELSGFQWSANGNPGAPEHFPAFEDLARML